MNSTDGAPANYPFLATSLYYGSPGVAIFLSQLADASTGADKLRWTSLATAALEDVRKSVEPAILEYGINAGFYYGLAGIAWSLRVVGTQLQGSEVYFGAARQLEAHILYGVKPFCAESGAKLWNNTDIAHGASGTGLAFLWSAGKEEEPAWAHALQFGAIAAGKWLVQQAQNVPSGDGLRWWRGPDTDGNHTGEYFPSFCCGTAGVGYYLAELSLAQGVDNESQAAFIHAAQQAGKHVLALGVEPVKGAMILPHGEQAPDTAVFF